MKTLIERLARPDGQTIAYRKIAGGATGPGVVWLSGFKSDMGGTKAQALCAWAEANGRTLTLFDYFGHGASSGAFAAGTVSRWLEDALAVLDELTTGPQVLVGSSMGGWIATLAALARPERVAGMVLIAPAADFTEALIWENAPDDVRRQIMERGVWERPSAYDPDPYPITRGLIEDGRRHLILGGPIDVRCPVRVLHGMADADVPWKHGMRLVERLASRDVVVQLVKDGGHRLSTPADIARMCAAVDEIVASLRLRVSYLDSARKPSR
jgi:pimeloyl-ACP methyl ester carboxylesterase